MIKEKILIHYDRGGAEKFEQSINQTVKRANELIDAWHSFQPWNVIETPEQAIELIKDPGAMLDRILLNAVNIQVIGKSHLNPDVIADMLDIDRANWLNLVEGKPIKETCAPCKKVKIHKGQTAISLDEFASCTEFIYWSDSHFVVNTDVVNIKKQSFMFFADSLTPAQTELNDYWHNVCDTLNSLRDKGYLGNEILKTLEKSLNNILMYSYATNKLHISEEMLKNEILKTT